MKVKQRVNTVESIKIAVCGDNSVMQHIFHLMFKLNKRKY